MVFIDFCDFIDLDYCLGTSGVDCSFSGSTIDQSENVFVTGYSANAFFGPTIGLKILIHLNSVYFRRNRHHFNEIGFRFQLD